jgi:hypothetical protein
MIKKLTYKHTGTNILGFYINVEKLSIMILYAYNNVMKEV